MRADLDFDGVPVGDWQPQFPVCSDQAPGCQCGQLEFGGSRDVDHTSRKTILPRSVAKTLAATDPDRAERLAQWIRSEKGKALLLVSVAEAVAATDPTRARRLLADAERLAQSITGKNEKVEVLVRIAKFGTPTW